MIEQNNQIMKNRKELADDIAAGMKDDPITRRFSLVVEKSERKRLVKELKSKRPEN